MIGSLLEQSILEHGLRHSTLSAQMPSESSSVVSNATNGIEPPQRITCPLKNPRRDLLSRLFRLMDHTEEQLYSSVGDDRITAGYIKVVSVMQKFFDQAISGNWSYNPENYSPITRVPVSVMGK